MPWHRPVATVELVLLKTYCLYNSFQSRQALCSLERVMHFALCDGSMDGP
jgi:hypothetical protein